MKIALKRTMITLFIITLMLASACQESNEKISNSQRPIVNVNDSTQITINRMPLPYFSYEYSSTEDWIKYIKNKFGLDIEINVIDAMHQSGLLTGSYLVDSIENGTIEGLIELSGGYLYSLDLLKSKNLILPLNDYLEDNNTFQSMPTSYKEAYMSPTGEIWALPVMDSFGIFSRILRTDWLEELNLREPMNLDELYSVAKAFAFNDPNGNGIQDEHGMDISISEGPRNLTDIFIGNGCYLSNLSFSSIAFNHDTNAYEDALGQPGMLDALIYIESMVEEGILHINANFNFLESKNCGNFYDILYYFQEELEMEDWTEISDLNYGKEKTIMAQRPFISYVLPISTENPSSTINSFINVFLSDINGMASGAYGIEDINYSLKSGSLEVLTNEAINIVGINYNMLVNHGIEIKDIYLSDDLNQYSSYRSEAVTTYMAQRVAQFEHLYNEGMVFWDSHSTVNGDRKISRAFGESFYHWLSSGMEVSAEEFLASLIRTAKKNGNIEMLRMLNSEIGAVSEYEYD